MDNTTVMNSIIKITDNNEFFDRYTVYFKDGYMLTMSENPKSPQGVCLSDTWKKEYMDKDNQEIEFDELFSRVQEAIVDFINEK